MPFLPNWTDHINTKIEKFLDKKKKEKNWYNPEGAPAYIPLLW